jgi:lipopolysaccharide exporter
VISKLSGEVGTVAWTFAAGALIKVASSMVLTRLLAPEAYGIVTMVVSVLFTIEMLSDLGFAILIVRHANAESEPYLQTVWTVRFIRAILNTLVVWFAAPYIASFFNAEGHVNELRWSCIYVLANGVETLGYLLAIRHHKSRVVSIMELVATAISTLLAILWVYYLERGPMGIVMAMMAHRCLMAAASYIIVPYHRTPRFTLDRESLLVMKGIAKTTVIASFSSLALLQLDKLIIAKLMPLSSVGLYGVGQNFSAMAEGIGGKLTSSVIFPRFTAAVRAGQLDAESAFTSILKPAALVLGIPILLGSNAFQVVSILYDHRYSSAGTVIVALCVRAYLNGYSSIHSNLLLAAGFNHIQATPNTIRAGLIFPLCWVGYMNFGFHGLLAAVACEPIFGLMYIKYVQARENLSWPAADKTMVIFSAITLLGGLLITLLLSFVRDYIKGWA